MMHSLEANNKLINGKSKWAHKVEGAGEKPGLGFISTSAASVVLVSSIILCRFGGPSCKVPGNQP